MMFLTTFWESLVFPRECNMPFSPPLTVFKISFSSFIFSSLKMIYLGMMFLFSAWCFWAFGFVVWCLLWILKNSQSLVLPVFLLPHSLSTSSGATLPWILDHLILFYSSRLVCSFPSTTPTPFFSFSLSISLNNYSQDIKHWWYFFNWRNSISDTIIFISNFSICTCLHSSSFCL